MGILVQLLIMNFNGTVLDVGLAVTLFSAVSVPSTLFWGFVTDRFHRRRPLIMVSFVATAFILARTLTDNYVLRSKSFLVSSSNMRYFFSLLNGKITLETISFEMVKI